MGNRSSRSRPIAEMDNYTILPHSLRSRPIAEMDNNYGILTCVLRRFEDMLHYLIGS